MKLSKSLKKFTFKYFYSSNKKITSDIITINGIDNDHIFNNIRRKKNFYEHDLLFHLFKTIKSKDKVIIDVGANIGNHAIYFGKYLCKKVIAIEPSQMHSDILKQNLNANLSSDEFEIHQIAAGNKKGDVSLVFPSEINLGAAKIDTTLNTENLITENVKIDKLDNIIYDENICLLKIDVEGLEIDVLNGAKRIIKKNLPHIIVEAHNKERLDEMKEFLDQFNYTILGRFCYTPTYHFINTSKHKKINSKIFSKINYSIVNILNRLNKYL